MKGRSSTVLALLLAATEWANLAAGQPDEFRPPANLQVEPFLRSLVDRMWEVSPTFRRQCRRLEAEQSLQVTVSREDQPALSSFANARTALTFKGNVPVAAHVYLKTQSNGAELIAHELEHILEQLDGVDLQAQAGNGAVWKGDRTSFETRRAIETGRRVAREIMDGGRAVESRKGDTGQALQTPMTVRLQDRQTTPNSPRTARVSADGRHVVFISPARLVDDDRNQLHDVYVTDLTSGRSTLESVGLNGASADGDSLSADISDDGRYVVFASEAGDLIGTSTTPGTAHIFLRDRRERTTRLLTTNAFGDPANGPSWNPVISADGTTVAFESGADDLLSAGAERPHGIGIYLIRFGTGIRTRVDATITGQAPVRVSSMSPAISADGRYVVFASKADLTCQSGPGCVAEPPDRNHVADVYIYDSESHTTRRVSHNPTGGDPDGASYDPAISGDGKFVAFVSEATNLTRSMRDSRRGRAHIYLHDLVADTTELVSRTQSGRAANGASLRPALSFDGSMLAFQSVACNLLCEGKCLDDINLLWDVFVYDRRTARIMRMSEDGSDEWMETSRGPSIDGAGRVVAFGSRHPIDADDTANDEDLYVVRIGPARLLSTRLP